MCSEHDSKAAPHELTGTKIACTRLSQGQADQNPNTDGGGVPEVPTLSEELLAKDGCSGGRVRFPWGCRL